MVENRTLGPNTGSSVSFALKASNIAAIRAGSGAGLGDPDDPTIGTRLDGIDSPVEGIEEGT